MLAIDYNIEIGSLRFKPSDNSRLTDLSCRASLYAPVNHCRISLTAPADLSMATGDTVSVSLGYTDNSSTVFTGVATGIEWLTDQVIVEAESQTRQLTALLVNEYFENSFAGEIVSGLAGETDMATGQIQPGLRFSFYAVGSNRSAWDHMSELSKQCGFDLYADEKDQLVFGMAIPGAPLLFQYGINILALQVEELEGAVKGIELFGESPASFGGGPDASSWFTKKEVKGSAGSNPKRRVFAPSARTQETAVQMANNIWNGMDSKKTGRLRTTGKADITLGAIALVSNMPTDSQNGTYKVTGIAHRLNSVKGFLTELSLKEL